MSINHTELKKCLRVLAESPKKIAEAKEKCKAALEEVAAREKTGNWSPNAIKKGREDAIAERDRVCHALAHAMRPALEMVRANNGLAEEPLDINSQKIQNAINVMALLGNKLTYADAASILESFRGDPASLRLIQSAFKKSGLDYAAKQAADMMRPISAQALDEMETVLNFHDYAESQGRLDFPIERAYWTKDEFEKQYQRLGYSDAGTDPFTYALDLALESITEQQMHPTVNDDPESAAKERAKTQAKEWKIRQAQKDVATAIANGADASTVFNRAMLSIERGAEAGA